MHQHQQQGSFISYLKQLFSQAEQLKQPAIAFFRDIHQNPEIGLKEFETSEKVRKFLANLEGLEVLQPLPNLPTAVIATITVQNPIQSILFRCQLDALALVQASGLPYASKNKLHHACGHDGHLTILLMAAKIIVTHRQRLRRNITFCFQPGEEGKRGAYKLFTEYPSLLEKIDHCYALHTNNSLSVGKIKITNGPVTALSNRVTISIKGKSVHPMIPHSGVDANYIGCTLVSQLYSLISLSVPALEGSTLVVSKVEGGASLTSVSDNFKIVASLRTFSMKSYELLKERITKMSEGLCDSLGATVTFQFGGLNYRPVINEEKLAKRTHKLLQKIKEFQVLQGQRVFAGEDFCQFSERKPSCYLSLGTALPNSIDETGQSIYPLHSPLHRMNEDAIQVGIKIWLALAFAEEVPEKK